MQFASSGVYGNLETSSVALVLDIAYFYWDIPLDYLKEASRSYRKLRMALQMDN